MIQDSTKMKLLDIITNPENNIINKFYNSCMETDVIEIEGVEKSMDLLNYVRSYLGNATSQSYMKHVFQISGYLLNLGIPTFMSFTTEVDRKEGGTYIAKISQSGVVGLPTSIYTSKSESFEIIINKYIRHISNMFSLLNYSNPNEIAKEAFEIEKSLAQIFVPIIQLRDPYKSYNKYTIEMLEREIPDIEWRSYFSSLGYLPKKINIASMNYITILAEKMKTFSISSIRSYLEWRILNSIQEYMPEKFRNENFEFFGKLISGLEEQPSRSEYCLNSISESLGFTLGKKFVEKHFSDISRNKATELVHDIKNETKVSITKLEWMDAITKTRALQKLSKSVEYIGNPVQWTIETDIEVLNSYFDNKMNFNQFKGKKIVERADQKVSKLIWNIPPQTVNAFYDPHFNSINLPSAILSSPFFNEKYPTEMNYGGIGFVISHEILHSFDNLGRMYDGNGNLEDWWSPEVSLKYEEKTSCLKDQYSKFEVLPGKYVDGSLTLSENIADVAGMKELFKALQNRFSRESIQINSSSIVENLTKEQLFFVSFAQSWCSLERTEESLKRLYQDVHSPPKYRVIGTLQNMKSFSTAFQCPLGSYMNPETKCEIF